MSNAYAQKKKNAIIAISVFLGLAMVLVVIIGILTTQTDLADRLDLPGITRTRRVIAAFCKPTHYKKECEKSLASAEEHNKGGAKHLDHKKLAAEAFKLTRAEITSALTKFPTVEVSPNDTRTQRALQVCTQLAKISIRDIERSERSIDHLGKGDFELFIEDLRVWTGGVLTYQDVCLNSFKKANGKAKDKMKVLLLKARERVANALAVIMEIENTPSGSEDEEEENEKEGESEEGKEKEGHKKEGKEKEGESEEGKEKGHKKEGKEKEGHENEDKEKEGSNNEEEKEKEGAKEGKEKEGPNNEEKKKKEGNKNEENEKEGSNNEEEKVKEGNNNKEKEKEGKNDNTKEKEGPNNKEEKGKEENKNEEKEKEGPNNENENEKEKEKEKEGNSNEQKEKELPNNKEENDKEKEGNKNEEKGSNNEGEKSKQENTNEEKEKEGANIKEEKKELQVPIKVEKESVGPGNKVESEKDKKEKEKEDEGATKEMEDEGEEKAKETTDKEKAKEESGKDKEGDEKKKEEPEPGKENEKEAPNGGEGKEGKENEKEAPKEGEGKEGKENEKEAPKGGEGKEGKEKEKEGSGEGKEGKEKEKEGPEGGEGKEGLKKNKSEAPEKKSVRMAGKFPEWVSDLKRGILGMPLAEIKPDIVVAKDGSGKVKTLREALHLLPKKSENTMVIYVKEGVYHEHVAINGRMTSVVLVGDGPTKTIISGAKSFADGWPSYMTGTIDIDGDGFIARDIGFENTAGPTKLQAAAARVSSDYAIFYNCQFSGFHNTLYAVRSRQFYRECTISGIVDFISGDALAVFQNCLLLFRTPLPGQPSDMTAQARSDSNGPGATIIQNCTITTEPGVDPSQSDAFLGRPRRPYSRTIIMQSFIDKVISPLGWTPYAGKLGLNTLFYAEFRNKGPGSLDSGRVNWPGIQSLTMEEAGEFSPGKFFAGTDEWITNTGCPYYGNMLPM